jgi:energy-coupling factor transporter transmembrane protein EcfT
MLIHWIVDNTYMSIRSICTKRMWTITSTYYIRIIPVNIWYIVLTGLFFLPIIFICIYIYGKRPLQGLPWSHWRAPCCLHILWMKSVSFKNTGKYAVKCSWENYIKMNEWHEFNDKEHFYIESQKLASKSSPSKKSLWRSTCNLDNEQNTNHWM